MNGTHAAEAPYHQIIFAVKACSSVIMFWLLSSLSPACAVDTKYQFTGLPHYRWYADRPGLAEDEFLGQAAPYVFSLVRYEFSEASPSSADIPANDVHLLLFAFSLPGEIVYNGPATLEILDGDSIIHEQVFKASDEKSLYELAKPLPDTGRYALRVTLHSPGKRVVSAIIPFQLASQKNGIAPLIGTTLVVLLALVFLWIRSSANQQRN